MSKGQMFAKMVVAGGETVAEMFHAPNALDEGADLLSQGLYVLSETLIRGLHPDERGGGFGGDFGYGLDFENDVFYMHRFCWCEKNDGTCLYCLHGDHPDFDRLLRERWGTTDYRAHRGRRYYDPPHFQFKATDFRVTWYKYIGRDMTTNRDISVGDWVEIWNACMASIPEDARRRAQEAHDFENTPEYLERERQAMEEFARSIRDGFRSGAIQYSESPLSKALFGQPAATLEFTPPEMTAEEAEKARRIMGLDKIPHGDDT